MVYLFRPYLSRYSDLPLFFYCFFYILATDYVVFQRGTLASLLKNMEKLPPVVIDDETPHYLYLLVSKLTNTKKPYRSTGYRYHTVAEKTDRKRRRN